MTRRQCAYDTACRREVPEPGPDGTVHANCPDDELLALRLAGIAVAFLSAPAGAVAGHHPPVSEFARSGGPGTGQPALTAAP